MRRIIEHHRWINRNGSDIGPYLEVFVGQRQVSLTDRDVQEMKEKNFVYHDGNITVYEYDDDAQRAR